MPIAQQEELRAALRMLETKIAQFETRARQAAVQCAADDPMQLALRRQLQVLLQERDRLRQQLQNLSP